MPGTSSELLHCIEPKSYPEEPHFYDCKVFDGAVIVHCLPTTDACTFNEYARKIFIPSVERQHTDANRIDIVWDTFLADSLKTSSRKKRGKGVKRKVADQKKVPKKWNDFLYVSETRQELFSFLTNKVKEHEFPEEHIVVITDAQSVSVVGTESSEFAFPVCNHEEADTQIFVHIRHAVALGAKRLQVRTVDTDVIVILVGKFDGLKDEEPHLDLWVAFGMGMLYRHIHINAIYDSLGEIKSRGLPL